MNRSFRFAPSLVILALSTANSMGYGQSANDISARSVARKQKSWYFSDHLGFKQKSGELDLLYRFYQSKGSKEEPQIESLFWGSFSSFQGNRSLGLGTGYAYGARIFLDNFVSGILGIPTLNIVPGIQGQRQRRSFTNETEEVSVWGPSLRFFGLSQQDSQVRFSYVQHANSAKSFPSRAWRFEVSGELFLSPFLALHGEGYLPQEKYGPADSKGSFYERWRAGAFLELGPVRLGYDYGDERFMNKVVTSVQTQLAHTAYLGLSY